MKKSKEGEATNEYFDRLYKDRKAKIEQTFLQQRPFVIKNNRSQAVLTLACIPPKGRALLTQLWDDVIEHVMDYYKDYWRQKHDTQKEFEKMAKAIVNEKSTNAAKDDYYAWFFDREVAESIKTSKK